MLATDVGLVTERAINEISEVLTVLNKPSLERTIVFTEGRGKALKTITDKYTVSKLDLILIFTVGAVMYLWYTGWNPLDEFGNVIPGWDALFGEEGGGGGSSLVDALFGAIGSVTGVGPEGGKIMKGLTDWFNPWSDNKKEDDTPWNPFD